MYREHEKLESFKDLGVIFDKRLTFGDHMHEKINKANNVLGIVKRNFINKWSPVPIQKRWYLIFRKSSEKGHKVSH